MSRRDPFVCTFNLRFPGQYFDKESNRHYNYFRDYNPKTGRYDQSDPIGLKGGTNTYGYANQNPVRYSDLKGLKPVPCPPGLSGASCDDGLGNASVPPKCVTAECVAGVLPNPPPTCCDSKALSQCLVDEGATGGLPCTLCALSKGKNKQACNDCRLTGANALKCFAENCGKNKCSNCAE